MRNFNVVFIDLEDNVVWNGKCSEDEVPMHCERCKSFAKDLNKSIRARFYDEPQEFIFHPHVERSK